MSGIDCLVLIVIFIVFPFHSPAAFSSGGLYLSLPLTWCTSP